LAGDRTLQLKWNQLAPLLTGEKVVLRLEGGERENGRVATVQPDHPALKRHDRTVARASIRDMRLVHLCARGRIIGTVGGLAGGVGIGMAIAVIFGAPAMGQPPPIWRWQLAFRSQDILLAR
jgi:hypothetical protein